MGIVQRFMELQGQETLDILHCTVLSCPDLVAAMRCDPARKHVVVCVYREWLVMSRIVCIGSREHSLRRELLHGIYKQELGKCAMLLTPVVR